MPRLQFRKIWLQSGPGSYAFSDPEILHSSERIRKHSMVSMAVTPQQYDAIIIGAGQAGTPLSTTLAAAGMRTALIERKHVGGTCVNEGCTPTKTMVASGRVAYLARRAADYGVRTGAISIDLQTVRRRKRDIVDSFRNGSQARIEKTANLELIFGDARFTSPKTVEVRSRDGAPRLLSAKYVFINAGTRASRPKLDGLDDVPTLDNVSIMELDAVPEHLLILGGGYIGLEFGQLFRRFGSRVTIVQSGAQLLIREDPDIAEEVRKILQQDGIEILLSAKATRVRQTDGNIWLEVLQQGPSTTLAGSHLLVATGRVPNSDTLNLAVGHIQTDERGFIKVNERLETTAKGVYALGDIKGGPAFTHISYDDFRVIRANLLANRKDGKKKDGKGRGGKKRASTRNRLVPYTVFIDPQLGRVGLTETEARARSLNIRVAKLQMTSVARALETDETRGFMKAIVDVETNRILGAAVLGIEGGEVMAAFEIAMMGKLPYTALRDGIFAHPTLVESLNNLFPAMDSGK
jgi:pyruvate/2-oxoglutarate dehydrogenase complex dihydrolipoamide dehydrogenase (E3) component